MADTEWYEYPTLQPCKFNLQRDSEYFLSLVTDVMNPVLGGFEYL